MIYDASLVKRVLPVVLLASLAGCEDEPLPGRPAPTPGPIAAVTSVASLSGSPKVERGEIVRFAVIGTGTGTHFGPATFVQAAGFEEMTVVAVDSSAKLWAQGRVSFGAPAGKKDLAVVTGSEIAVAPWALEVVAPDVVKLGAPPVNSEHAAAADASVLDPAGDVDVYEIESRDRNLRTLVIRADTPAGSPLELSLEVYAMNGARLAAPRYPCAVVQTRGEKVLARVTDAGRRGGEGFRYRLVAGYEQAEACLTWQPGSLPP